MFKRAAVFAFLATPALAGGPYGIGTVATPEQVSAWDIDVRPDGKGALEGRGTAEEGEELYADYCASCHGDFGDGGDNARYPVLVGGSPEELTEPNPDKTIGSYWPYASTVVDYIYRAMPFGAAQTLTPDETYAISAWLLAENGIIDYDFELSHDTIGSVEMPNEGGFFDDPRPDGPKVAELSELCMSDCVETVTVTHYARILDVTPEADGEGISAE